MKQARTFVLTLFALAPCVFGQDGTPVIKAEVLSAFVWGADSPSGAVSSTIQDPLTGSPIYMLSHDGVEVSSRMGFERVNSNEVGIFLNYATTIVNSTDATLSVRYGGISIDGHVASPLRVVPVGGKIGKKDRKSKPDTVELGKIHCLTSGFLSSDNFFSANAGSQVFSVTPGTALKISTVIRDPRTYHPLLCSVEGCYPTGTIRYYLTINHNDYVFVWSGRAAVYCGV
jgi:hypothetical protein